MNALLGFVTSRISGTLKSQRTCRITVATISVKRQNSAHVSHYCSDHFSQSPKFSACVALLSQPFQSSAKVQRIFCITVAVISVKRQSSAHVSHYCRSHFSQAPKFSACVALLSQPFQSSAKVQRIFCITVAVISVKRQSSAHVSHYCRSHFNQLPKLVSCVNLQSNHW